MHLTENKYFNTKETGEALFTYNIHQNCLTSDSTNVIFLSCSKWRKMTDQEGGEVRWRLEAPGRVASRGAGRAGAEEGADVGAAMDGCEGGEAHTGTGVHSCMGGNATQ
jgi:hypothetical protein